MKRFSLTAFLLFLTVLGAQAQTITRTVFPSVGTVLTYFRDTTNFPQLPSSTGAGQTWTFTFNPDTSSITTYVDTTGIPNIGDFPDANLVSESDNGYEMFKKTPDTLFTVGNVLFLNGIFVSLPFAPAPVIAHNTSLGASVSGVRSGEVTLPSSIISPVLAQVGIDSLRLQNTSDVSISYDAGGTLNINNTTFTDALREKTVTYSNSLFFSRVNGTWEPGLTIQGQVILPAESKDTSIVYSWWVNDTVGFVLQLSYDAQENITNIQYRLGEPQSTSVNQQLAQSTTVFPNPTAAGADLSIRTTLASASNLSVRMLDVTGRVVFQRSFDNQPAGAFETQIATDSLPAGLYFVELSNGSGAYTTKVLVTK